MLYLILDVFHSGHNCQKCQRHSSHKGRTQYSGMCKGIFKIHHLWYFTPCNVCFIKLLHWKKGCSDALFWNNSTSKVKALFISFIEEIVSVVMWKEILNIYDTHYYGTTKNMSKILLSDWYYRNSALN